MQIVSHYLKFDTADTIDILNITSAIQQQVEVAAIRQGHVVIFSCHTTTALTVNEHEERLLTDIKTYLRQLAPPQNRYLHNDLHLRDVPPDEPINAHSHLMAMTLGNSETVPIVNGELALGTYQSVMLVDLDGPRQGRQVLIQICGV
ncbi:secondary thiamine-phosphate synthase enzyme [Leptolyngbya sp. Heron Island J]|uniref:secondary thiamine-phosphate synthase enzyme YjbQ n=1 Tax=Leptolyngbya sp. Heron Island J TaxID=1385935 RepID=UPI0003B999F7|nr:secondary thiamine-phosphate synthase enzyme YjbQ [Leptolyngbya sp. Heron Island J]ESA32344.1 secondary thiamine-phosphate synthase enzyme [Leptolyngbya sp. Heron Island J]